MGSLSRETDTICAVSTAQGVGGIAVIRVSGSRAFEIVKKIAPSLPANPESHKIYLCNVEDWRSQELVDESLISTFHNGKSFTGEETVEISCHGSQVISSRILSLLAVGGARLANRGEFTLRSFMNGKIDLIQAEGVLNLIESTSKSAATLALRQLKGGLSKKIDKLENDIVFCLAHLEASIDFSTENLDTASNPELLERTKEIQQQVLSLLKGYQSGKLIQHGLKVAIVGVPNVGKSSFLNLMLDEERAIVTNIPGTTRDLISDQIMVDGYIVNFVDTAGYRETDDPIEKQGIKKAMGAKDAADLVVFLLDCSADLTSDEIKILNSLDPARTLIVLNKRDLLGGSTREEIVEKFLVRTQGLDFMRKSSDDFENKNIEVISAPEIIYRDSVLKNIKEIGFKGSHEDVSAISQARHFECLEKVNQRIENLISLIGSNVSAEFLALDFKEALFFLHEMSGKRADEEIIDKIFKEFCLGK